MHYHTPYFSVFFGTKQNGLKMPAQRGLLHEEDVHILQLTAAISEQLIGSSELSPAHRMPLHAPVTFLQQLHSTTSHIIDNYDDIQKFSLRSYQGDGLITTLNRVGIGVLTADCLPIIFYNKTRHALAVIHAGWRGLISNIIGKTLRIITSRPNGNDEYEVVLGPAAHKCCYQVAHDFLSIIPQSHHFSLEKRDSHWYFDLIAYAVHDLTQQHIVHASIHIQSICTICSSDFYSHRREGSELLHRQATVALLYEKP